MAELSEPQCCRCDKPASKIPDIAFAAKDADMSPAQFVREEEGTYSRKTNLFACTPCYIALGQPSQMHTANGKRWTADRKYSLTDHIGTGPAGNIGTPLRSFQERLLGELNDPNVTLNNLNYRHGRKR